MKQPKRGTAGEWIPESEETVVQTPIMNLVRRRCRSSESEARHDFYILKSRDWCNVIPVTEDGKIVMVRQFRVGNEVHTLELPGGVCDASDADPGGTALRELREETGYELAPGARCVSLGHCLPNPAIQDNRTHSFLAGPVRRTADQHLDPAEMIEIVEVPIAELPARIASGEIGHALMLVTLLLAALQDPSGSFGQSLTKQLLPFGRV
jgi:8-oxo-dGTP pyrophosphatase MutT (NUDIX family)